MWPDIEKVPLVEEIPAEIKKLSRTAERFTASRFFSSYSPFEWNIVQVDSSEKLQVKSWLNWASIVTLSAVGDSLHRDLEEFGLADKWRASEERRNVYAHPLLAVLFELRNYEVHFEFREGEVRNFRPLVGYGAKPNVEPQEKDLGDEFFFSPIDFTSLSRLRNIQSGRSSVTVEMVDWFNRQASTWPAAYLIGVARQVYAEHVARFLREGFG